MLTPGNKTAASCGNLTDDGEKTMFYDYANRLVELDVNTTDPIEWHRSQFRYDALGRRVGVFHLNTTLCSWIYTCYDGQQAVMDHSPGSGLPIRFFVYGIGIDEPLMVYTYDSIDADDDQNVEEWLPFYYHFNQLGSVVSVTDYESDVVERYEYDVYGYPTIYDKNGDQVGYPSKSPLKNRFMFTGREWDGNEVACGLYHYRARAYNPITGRFLQRDLLRDIELNLYQYGKDNPVVFLDPFGQFWVRYGNLEVGDIFVENEDRVKRTVAGQRIGGYTLRLRFNETTIRNPRTNPPCCDQYRWLTAIRE